MCMRPVCICLMWECRKIVCVCSCVDTYVRICMYTLFHQSGISRELCKSSAKFWSRWVLWGLPDDLLSGSLFYSRPPGTPVPMRTQKAVGMPGAPGATVHAPVGVGPHTRFAGAWPGSECFQNPTLSLSIHQALTGREGALL